MHHLADDIPILYYDGDIAAVHKPAGLKVHRDARYGRQERCALEIVRDRLGRWVHPVHRLDRPTSGVLLFALNPDAAAILAASFARREVRKTYLAVVRGHVAPAGTIDHPLTRDAGIPKKGQTPKPARTDYERLATTEMAVPVGRYDTSRYSLVRLYPITGRMHQIRRHLHHISHPVIGDTVYGDGRHNRFFREHFGCRRLLLAAMALHFMHPRTGAPLEVVAPLEGSFAEVVHRLEWRAVLPGQWRV